MNKAIAMAVGLLGAAVPSMAHARLVELTFDDGEAGSAGELANLEALRNNVGVEPARAALVGTAVRSALSAGRYGRAAELRDGAGYIEITNLPVIGSTPTLYLWVKAGAVDQGTLLEAVGVYRVLLDRGTLVLEANQIGRPPLRVPFGPYPDDGLFHHLTITAALAASPAVFSVSIDRVRLPDVSAQLVASDAIPELRLGEGFTGLVDELLFNLELPAGRDALDRDPRWCPPGLACLEEVFTMTPAGFPYEVPVRFKSVYDAQRCTAAAPCPLLVDVSGGNDCADDYAEPVSVSRFARAGFFVVTPDAYCETSSRSSPYPTETSQFVAIKNHLQQASPLKALIRSGSYAASGCSHGAGAVTVWALHEPDHPARIYARSPGLDALCVLATEVACPAVTERNEQRIIDELGSLDWSHPRLEAVHRRGASADHITEAVARSQDLAISWGVNLAGPVCYPDGNWACSEEGLWGMNWGARRFRDVWQMREAPGAPTGYFVQDQGADCRHCASEDSKAFGCGLCLLQHGRAGMAAACADCLDYSGVAIAPGGTAEQCLLPATWYTDPLAQAGGSVGQSVSSDGADAQSVTRPPRSGCSLGAGLQCVLLAAAMFVRRARRRA